MRNSADGLLEGGNGDIAKGERPGSGREEE